MKIRRVIYLLIFALAAYFIYLNSQTGVIVSLQSISKQEIFSNFADLFDTAMDRLPIDQSISKQEIFSDFADLSDNNIPKATLGGQFFTTEVFFPDDFVGNAGDEFYVSMEDGHTLYTQRYIIKEADAQPKKTGKLVYKLKVNLENFQPPAGKYESYKFDGKKWTKV